MSAHGSRSLGGPSENLRGLGSPFLLSGFQSLPTLHYTDNAFVVSNSSPPYNLYINTFTLLFRERRLIWQNNKRGRKSFHPSHLTVG